MKKEIIYIDIDDTIGKYTENFRSYKRKFPEIEFPQSLVGFYLNIEPFDNAISVVKELLDSDNYLVYFLTAPSFKNPHSYSEKRLWIEIYFGMKYMDRLIISPNKGLNKGDWLIDDYSSGKGQENFEGTLIHFGSDERFDTWLKIKAFFIDKL